MQSRWTDRISDGWHREFHYHGYTAKERQVSAYEEVHACRREAELATPVAIEFVRQGKEVVIVLDR